MSSYQGFGKGSGPTGPPKSQPTFGLHNPFPRPPSSSSSHPLPPRPRSIESSGWSDGQKLFYKDLDARNPERPPFTALHDSMTGVAAGVSRFPNPERTRSPPISYADVDDLRNSSQTVLRNNCSNLLIDDHGHLLPPKSQSPPLVPVNYQSVQNVQGPISVRQPTLARSALDSQTGLSVNDPNFPGHQLQSSVSPYIDSQNPRPSFTKELNNQGSKRTRSPPSPSTNIQENFNFAPKEFRRQ